MDHSLNKIIFKNQKYDFFVALLIFRQLIVAAGFIMSQAKLRKKQKDFFYHFVDELLLRCFLNDLYHLNYLQNIQLRLASLGLSILIIFIYYIIIVFLTFQLLDMLIDQCLARMKK
ncbi:hypothetical protein BpHYR1_032088 [Brachionus plicatilis]|uniref:Uncharacterized protein n=1 Tax=Brachionus plicatilis TaxID=10195 RepID=A0A3M7T0T1_BRAPC|nr:hypothetical protein BpHYR1_032088 [Brachionus plicatilis]